jgi:hypothetical protein
MARQKDVLDRRVRTRDCPSGRIGKGQFATVLFVCAACVKLRQIVRERSMAHRTMT